MPSEPDLGAKVIKDGEDGKKQAEGNAPLEPGGHAAARGGLVWHRRPGGRANRAHRAAARGCCAHVRAQEGHEKCAPSSALLSAPIQLCMQMWSPRILSGKISTHQRTLTLISCPAPLLRLPRRCSRRSLAAPRPPCRRPRRHCHRISSRSSRRRRGLRAFHYQSRRWAPLRLRNRHCLSHRSRRFPSTSLLPLFRPRLCPRSPSRRRCTSQQRPCGQ